MKTSIKPLNPLLTWLYDMIKIAGANDISIPSNFREQSIKIKQILRNDTSGLTNSLLDFAIDCALVDYRVDTSNANLTDALNGWLTNVNSDMRGEIPVGIKALAKEYFRERWKGSSFLLLRTFWEEKDNFIFPNLMYFVNGEDIEVESDEETLTLDGKIYYLKTGKTDKDKKPLPSVGNEKIFIQKPYTAWGEDYPVPFLIQRGILENLLFLDLLTKKGQHIVSKALEYLMLLKKGTEGLVNNPDFVYSDDDLKKLKENITDFATNRQNATGISTFVTNFDTTIEHLIPEYSKALTAELYTPIERRILAGIGMVEVTQGLSSSRKESILNPKPFFAEIKTAIDDFKTILTDIINTIIDENQVTHKKYFSNGKLLRITNTMVKESITSEQLTHLRSAYDRGIISKKTYSEIVGTDFEVEIERRKREIDEGLDVTMYPPIIQNQEQNVSPEEQVRPIKPPKGVKQIDKVKDIPPDKQGPEAKNYNQMSKEEANVVEEIVFEQAPYTKDTLPKQIQSLPSGAQSIWLNTFNAVYDDSKDDNSARMAAWRNVKLKYKRVGDKWIQKTKGEFEESAKEIGIDELIKIKKLEILGKQNAILDKLIEENEVK